jgi:hypothetical protein
MLGADGSHRRVGAARRKNGQTLDSCRRLGYAPNAPSPFGRSMQGAWLSTVMRDLIRVEESQWRE